MRLSKSNNQLYWQMQTKISMQFHEIFYITINRMDMDYCNYYNNHRLRRNQHDCYDHNIDYNN